MVNELTRMALAAAPGHPEELGRPATPELEQGFSSLHGLPPFRRPGDEITECWTRSAAVSRDKLAPERVAIPLLGLVLRRSGQIPMDRNNPWKALKSLRQAADLLKEGISVLVFPEGTRTRNGEIQEFKTALFILPIRSRIPVVPVLIEGTFQALKRGSILLNPVPLKLTFYDPIPADSFGVRDRGIYAEKVRQVLAVSMLRL